MLVSAGTRRDEDRRRADKHVEDPRTDEAVNDAPDKNPELFDFPRQESFCLKP